MLQLQVSYLATLAMTIKDEASAEALDGAGGFLEMWLPFDRNQATNTEFPSVAWTMRRFCAMFAKHLPYSSIFNDTRFGDEDETKEQQHTLG